MTIHREGGEIKFLTSSLFKLDTKKVSKKLWKKYH